MVSRLPGPAGPVWPAPLGERENRLQCFINRFHEKATLIQDLYFRVSELMASRLAGPAVRKGTNHSGIQPTSRFHDGRADGLFRTFLARTTASAASAQGSPPTVPPNTQVTSPQARQRLPTTVLAGIHPRTAAAARIPTPPPRWLPQAFALKTGLDLDWEIKKSATTLL